ncbi:hypothetical protein VB620_14435, partial [Nodularia harveyana UHCC-0300]|nr:hypothetical protein [Nodularia harveyana UHCC-0300]
LPYHLIYQILGRIFSDGRTHKHIRRTQPLLWRSLFHPPLNGYQSFLLMFDKSVFSPFAWQLLLTAIFSRRFHLDNVAIRKTVLIKS